MSNEKRKPSIEWMLTTIIGAGTLLFAVVSFQASLNEKRSFEAWQVRAELYREMLQLAGTIAAGTEGYDEARERIRTLNAARASLIADEKTRYALKSFLTTLNRCDLCKDGKAGVWDEACSTGKTGVHNSSTLQKQLGALSICARLGLEKTWNANLDDEDLENDHMGEIREQTCRLVPPPSIESTGSGCQIVTAGG